MIHAYDKLYLSVAQKNLACMLDYMVNDLNGRWKLYGSGFV